MSDPDIVATIRPLIAAFDELGIPYHIGGSVASSAFGMARSTLDIDIVAPVPAAASSLRELCVSFGGVQDRLCGESLWPTHTIPRSFASCFLSRLSRIS